MITGGLIREESSTVDDHIIPLLNEVKIGSRFSLGKLLEAVATIVIIVGVFVFIVSATGGIGACCRNRILLVIVS